MGDSEHLLGNIGGSSEKCIRLVGGQLAGPTHRPQNAFPVLFQTCVSTIHASNIALGELKRKPIVLPPTF